jgi:ABC-type transport system involved in multi-copper enzyme maturation permease subunit
MADLPVGYALPLSGLPMEQWQDYVLPWGRRGYSTAAIANIWHRTLWISPLPALLLFVLVVGFAAWRLAGSWQDKIPSLRQENLLRRYFTPLFRGWFARRMGRVLDRNPIVWLQQYSWKARLIKWVLCLAVVVIAPVLLGFNNPWYFRDNVEPLLFLTIVAGMTFAGVNSFAEEKSSGALELILVTPIPIRQIILGRVRGVWEQFLPAALILGTLDSVLALDLHAGWRGEGSLQYIVSLLPFFCVFLTLPVFALYSTLRVKNQIAALALTWFLLLLPYLSMCLLVWVVQIGFLPNFNMPEFVGTVVLPLANLALALAAFYLLRHRLTRRLYSFS